jgi:branched-chain amino acid transport system substrate-binding protein
MRKLRNRLFITILFAATALGAACRDSAPPPSATSTPPSASTLLRIAANLPLTGPVAAWSGQFPNGFQLGIEEAAAEAGISPTLFPTDFQDNAGQPAQASTVLQKQLTRGFDVYLAGSSESAKAVVGRVDPLNVPTFIVAFDPFMAAEQPSRLRIMANSKIEAPLFIDYAKRRAAKSVHMIHVNSAYAVEEFERIVRPALEKDGVKVTSEAYEFGTKDFKTLALKATRQNADLIYVCGYSFHLRPLLSDLRSLGAVQDGRVVGVMDVVDFLYDGTPKEELEGLVFASPQFDIPGAVPGADAWRARYVQKFGKNPSYVPAYAYDNARVIVRAYKQFGNASVESIRKVLPMQGVTGIIQLDADGDIIATVSMARVSASGTVEAVK